MRPIWSLCCSSRGPHTFSTSHTAVDSDIAAVTPSIYYSWESYTDVCLPPIYCYDVINGHRITDSLIL